MGFFDFLKPKNIIVDQSNDMGVNLNSQQTYNNGSFEFAVEDVFSISGRGTVVTGRVLKGSVSVGDHVRISSSGIQTVVTGIEMFRKTLEVANEGDNAGLLLRGLAREQVKRGDVIIR